MMGGTVLSPSTWASLTAHIDKDAGDQEGNQETGYDSASTLLAVAQFSAREAYIGVGGQH